MVRVARVAVRCAALVVASVLAAVVCRSDAQAHVRPATAQRPKPPGRGGPGARGRKGRHRRHAPRLKPAPPLAVLPTLTRIELAVDTSFVIVTETIQLTRNDWEKGELRVCIGHGAPGAPKAFEARLQTPDEAKAKALPSEYAPSCPVNARLVLGGPQMATSVVTMSEPAIRAAFDKSDQAVLQIRFLVEAPYKEADGGRELLLRLGAPEDVPITVSSIAIRPRSERVTIAAAIATLCGPQADAMALSVEGAASGLPSLNPTFAIRRASDDLCVRYWANAR